jgi:hypothetical protein
MNAKLVMLATWLVLSLGTAMSLPTMGLATVVASASPAISAKVHSYSVGENASFLVAGQAATNGIKPGKPDRNGKIPTITATSTRLHPNSASGCNASVCINVVGSGLHVDKWTTTGYSTEPICTYAAYWVNGVIEATSEEVCGTSFTHFTSWWDNPGYFVNITQLCNTWIQIGGSRVRQSITDSGRRIKLVRRVELW